MGGCSSKSSQSSSDLNPLPSGGSGGEMNGEGASGGSGNTVNGSGGTGGSPGGGGGQPRPEPMGGTGSDEPSAGLEMGSAGEGGEGDNEMGSAGEGGSGNHEMGSAGEGGNGIEPEPSNTNVMIGFGPDEGRAQDQAIGEIGSMDIDEEGSIWFFDDDHHVIRKYNPVTNVLTTEHGTGDCLQGNASDLIQFGFPVTAVSGCRERFIEVFGKSNIWFHLRGLEYAVLNEEGEKKIQPIVRTSDDEIRTLYPVHIAHGIENDQMFLLGNDQGRRENLIGTIHMRDLIPRPGAHSNQPQMVEVNVFGGFGLDGWCNEQSAALPCIGPDSTISIHPEDGELLIVEPDYGCIRKISPETGAPHTWIGPCEQVGYTDPEGEVDIYLGEDHGIQFRDVAFDRSGDAWLATNEGIKRVHQDQLINIHRPDDALLGDGGFGLQQIQIAPDGSFWMLTGEGSLWRASVEEAEEDSPPTLSYERVLSPNQTPYPRSSFGDPHRIPFPNVTGFEEDSLGNLVVYDNTHKKMFLIRPEGQLQTLAGGGDHVLNLGEQYAMESEFLANLRSYELLGYYPRFTIKESGIADGFDAPFWDLWSFWVDERRPLEGYFSMISGLESDGKGTVSLFERSRDYGPTDENSMLAEAGLRSPQAMAYDAENGLLYYAERNRILMVEENDNIGASTVQSLLGPRNPDRAQMNVPQPLIVWEDIEALSGYDDIIDLAFVGGADPKLYAVIHPEQGTENATALFEVLLSEDAANPISKILDHAEFGPEMGRSFFWVEATEEGHVWLSFVDKIRIAPLGDFDSIQEISGNSGSRDGSLLSESILFSQNQFHVKKTGENQWKLYSYQYERRGIRAAEVQERDGQFDGVIHTIAGMVDSPNMGPLQYAELRRPKAFVHAEVDGQPETYFVAGGTSKQLFRVQLGDVQRLDAVAGYPEGFRGTDWRFSSRYSRFLNNASGVAFTTNRVDEISNAPAPTIFFAERGSNDLRFISYNDPSDLDQWIIGTLIHGTGGFDDNRPENQRVRWLEEVDLNQPTDLFFDQASNILYVADSGNHVVRGLDFQANRVFIVAGMEGASGIPMEGAFANQTSIHSPSHLTRDSRGNTWMVLGGEQEIQSIYFVDESGLIHYLHTCGLVNPQYELGRTPLRDACIQHPKGMDFDRDRNLYVTDGPRLWKVYRREDQRSVTQMSDAEIIFSAEEQRYPLSSIECLSDVDIVGNKARLIDECSGIMFEIDI